MEDEIITTPDSGATGPGTPAVGGGEQPQSVVDPINPGEGEGNQNPGRPRGEGGRFASNERAARPLEEMLTLGDAVGDMTAAERKAIRMSGRLGLRTQAEVDAHLATQTPGRVPGEAPAPKPNVAVPGKADPLSEILKAISPNLDPTKPETAITSIKELQTKVSTMGERNKQLEAYYPEVQAGIAARLGKGPEGIKELFTAFNVPVPAWLGNGAPAAPAAPQAPAEVVPSLADIKDEEFLDGRTIKGLLGGLTKSIASELRAEFEKTYGPIKQSHEKIVGRIQQDAQAAEIQTRRDSALKDLDFHSEFMGQFDPAEKMNAKAMDIWNASVGADGKLKATPHPEWPKLQKAMEYRKKEFLESGTDAATYRDFLARQLLDQEKLQKFVKGREASAKLAQLSAQQRRVQPAVVNSGRGGGGLDSLVMPKSVADVEAMTLDQKREFKKKTFQAARP